MSKALKSAIEANDPEAVRTALKKVKDVNRKLPGSIAPLAYACKLGADSVLEPLFQAGAVAEKPHAFQDDKPFAIAAANGKINVLRRFLDLKKVSDETLTETINHACYEGDTEILDFLLKETKPPINIEMFRLASAKKAAPDLLTVLLNNGGKVNARHDTDEARLLTVLHDLTSTGRADVLRVLLDAGADVNARDEFGRTPLIHLAAHLRSIEFSNNHARRTLRALRSGEAELLAGEAPSEVDPKQAIIALLDAGADAAATDNYGNDAMDYCRFEYWRDQENVPDEIVSLLKGAGARGSDAMFELLIALKNEDVTAARVAIANGADVNRPTPLPVSYTPLEAAAGKGPIAVEFVRLLLDAGANPNLSTRNGGPLIGAARAGNLQVLKDLVAAGADIHAVRRSGDYIENAYTASEEHEEVRAFLKSLGARNPTYEDKPGSLQPGVASWNDFDELLVKADVNITAHALAKLIAGAAHLDVYGRTFLPGEKAYVVIRPRGMEWSNIFQISPPRSRSDFATTRTFAAKLAKSSGAQVLSVGFSDTSDAAAIFRVEPDGEIFEDKGWDFETLNEFADQMGKDAPAWLKKLLAKSNEDDLTSAQRLVALAQEEKFVVAAFGFYCKPGKKLDVEVRGFGPEAFDGIAFVSN